MDITKKIKSNVVESYKKLRTNIQFSILDNNMKIILITSSVPDEGKTTISLNLAITISETDKKVLVIDGDLRKPTLHKKFEISNLKGLSNVLIDENTFEEAVQKCSNNLHVLTSGTIPPNPLEVLSSKKMKLFLDKLKDMYDYIILDSPPLMAVADAQSLATMADGVILVTSSGKSEIPVVKKAIESLQYVKANILGIVLNNVKDEKNRYYYYKGYENNQDKRVV